MDNYAPVSDRFSRKDLWFGLLLAFAACLPVLVAVQPQMTDYGAHLARYHVMLDGGQSADLAKYYTFSWRWTGNLGMDLLVWLLAPLMGLEAAAKLIIAIIPILTGLGILAVERTLRKRIGAGSILAFSFIWSPMLLMGFANYGLALAFAFFAFALWVRMAKNPRRWIVFLPIAVVVWLCHVSGWGILGVMVFGYELHQRRNLSAVIAPWPLTLPFVFTLLNSGDAGGVSWGNRVLEYKIATLMRTMSDQSADLDMASLVIVLAVLMIAAKRGRIDGRLGLAALIVFVLGFIMPRHIFGGDYADYRMLCAGLLLGCMALDIREPRWAIWAAGALFIVRLTVTTHAWYENSKDTERYLTVLEHLPRGTTVASAVTYDVPGWKVEAFHHICGFAVVRRDAFSNCNFAVPGVHMLGLRNPNAQIDPSQRVFVRAGERPDLSKFEAAKGMDYLWYVGRAKPTRLPLGAQVVYQTDGTLLARLAKQTP